MGKEAIYHPFFIILLILLSVMLLICLIRAVKGPRVADRLVAVNMMGTMVMVMISILALLLKEGYLVDICLIYAMISFLGVVVLCKVYTGVYLKDKKIQANMAAIEANLESQQGQPLSCGRTETMVRGDGDT